MEDQDTLQVHLILYSSSKALGLVIDLDRCLERPIPLGVDLLASDVVGANSAKAKAASSGLGGTPPLLALLTWLTAELLMVGGWRSRTPP